MMEDDNEDDLKNKEDLHIAGRHTSLDVFRFASIFFIGPVDIALMINRYFRKRAENGS